MKMNEIIVNKNLEVALNNLGYTEKIDHYSKSCETADYYHTVKVRNPTEMLVNIIEILCRDGKRLTTNRTLGYTDAIVYLATLKL